MADPLDLFCYLFLPLYMRVRLFLPDTIRKQSYKKVRKSLICRNARLFNGRVLAAEAFKWDLEQVSMDYIAWYPDFSHSIDVAFPG